MRFKFGDKIKVKDIDVPYSIIRGDWTGRFIEVFEHDSEKIIVCGESLFNEYKHDIDSLIDDLGSYVVSQKYFELIEKQNAKTLNK